MSAQFFLRLVVGVRNAVPQLQRTAACLPSLAPIPASHRILSSATCASSSACPTLGVAAAAARERRRQRRSLLHRLTPSASFTVVTGPGDNSSGGGGGVDQPWRLIIYSKEGCHLCDGLKEKVEALLERAEFLPSALSAAELEVRDIMSNSEWEAKYAMSIPVLAAAAADGGGEVEVPRPSPRLSADALQRHIEKFLATQPHLGQQ